MKIGVIETGEVNEAISAKHGAYPSMFARMLQAVDPDLTFFTVSVVRGELPGAPHDADGWIVTGSRHGVYDALPWIEPVKDFLRRALAEKVPVIGVCFGHQILAEAMGGKVVKSDKGWGLGVQEYTVTNSPAWMEGLGDHFTSHAVHQDQVITPPPGTTVLAENAFCQYASLAYGDIDAPLAISIQPHPEFSTEYVRDLMDVRLAEIVGPEIAKGASASLSRAVSNPDWARWMVSFLRAASARKAAAREQVKS